MCMSILNSMLILLNTVIKDQVNKEKKNILVSFIVVVMVAAKVRYVLLN